MEKVQHQNFSKVIVKAWSDPQFKAQLVKNPEEVLRTEGIELPQGTKIAICENTEKQCFFVIPKKPAGNLSEEELENIAAGSDPMADLTAPMAGLNPAAKQPMGDIKPPMAPLK